MRVANIYFVDSTSKCNKNLVEYLSRNIQNINFKAKIKVVLKIIGPKEQKSLKKMDVRKYPAMLIGKDIYEGFNEIVDGLNTGIRNCQKPAMLKSSEESVDEYIKQALGVPQDGKPVLKPEESEEQRVDLVARANEEMKRRNPKSGQANYINMNNQANNQNNNPAAVNNRPDNVGNDENNYQMPTQRQNNAMNQDDMMLDQLMDKFGTDFTI